MNDGLPVSCYWWHAAVTRVNGSCRPNVHDDTPISCTRLGGEMFILIMKFIYSGFEFPNEILPIHYMWIFFSISFCSRIFFFFDIFMLLFHTTGSCGSFSQIETSLHWLLADRSSEVTGCKSKKRGPSISLDSEDLHESRPWKAGLREKRIEIMCVCAVGVSGADSENRSRARASSTKNRKDVCNR